MAPLVVLCALRTAWKRPSTIAATYVRTYWNRDFKPGPYPRTPEERAAAAKKYGMLPEDYEPYPDDEFGHGDYPKLPDISHLGRDPYYDWDIPDAKRNFGEPIHVHDDIYVEDRHDVSHREFISYPKMALVFLTVMAGFATLFWLGEKYPMRNNVMPKNHPKPGVTHYTFEPANDSPR